MFYRYLKIIIIKKRLLFLVLIALAFNLSAQQNQQSESAPIYFKQKGVDSAPLNYARAQWDIIGEFDATSASQAGIETDGNHFFLPKWNDPAIVQYDMDGNELVAGITHGYGMSGTAYDNWTNPGNTTLWCYTQDYTTDNRSVLVAFDINTRTFGTAYDISSSCTSNSNGEAGGAMSFVHTEAPHLNNAFIMLNTQCDQEPNAIRVYLQWSGDGLKELNSNRGLAIFPNPAQNVFTINRPSADNSLMQIYDLSGRVVFSEVLMQSKTQIDISGLYASSYIVKVNNRVEKLIVQ